MLYVRYVRFMNVYFQVKKVICDWLAKLLFMKRPSATRSMFARWRPRSGDDPASSPATSFHVTAYDFHHDPAVPASVSSSAPNYEMKDGDTDRLSSAAMNEILYELRLLTGRLRDDEMRLAICSDWKFAAMVIDRFCLMLFTVFTIVSTCVILFSAPHFTA